MTTFETDVFAAATPERLWDVLADFERWPEWTTSMTRLERLDDGEPGPGFRVRVEQPGLRPAVFRVTEWRPCRAFRWVMGDAFAGARADHLLEPVAGGTRIVLRVTYSGVFAPILALAYGALTRRYIAQEAAGLVARAEVAR